MATKQPKKLKSYYAIDGQGQPVFGKGAAPKKGCTTKKDGKKKKRKPPNYRGLFD